MHTYTWILLCVLCNSLQGLNEIKCFVVCFNSGLQQQINSIGYGLNTCASKSRVDMCAYTYTRQFLLEKRRIGASVLPYHLMQTITDLCLNKSHRSTRAGHRKQRSIPVLCSSRNHQHLDRPTGVNFCNLRSLPRSEEVISKPSRLKFATTNAQSLAKKFNLLLEHISEFQYDLLTVSETWIKEVNDHDKAQYSDLGYNIIISPRHGRQGGGVGLVCKSNLCCQLISDLTNKCNSFEVATWLVKSAHFSLLVPVVYRPPSSSLTKFFDEFADFVTALGSYTQDYVVSGDFNIHFNKDSHDTVVYKDLLESLDLKQHVRCRTCKSGNVLDHIITSNSSKVAMDSSEPVEDLVFSDHSMVSLFLSFQKEEIKRKTLSYRPIKNVDPSDVRKGLSTIVSTSLQSTSSSLENAVSQIDAALHSLLEELAPIKTKRLTSRSKHPWFSDDASNLKQRKKRLEKQWRANRTPENWILYKNCRNSYSKFLYETKIDCYSTAISNCGHDAKRLFNTVSGLLGIVKNSNPFPESGDSRTLANNFAHFFYEKIVKIRTQLDHFPAFVAPERPCSDFNEFAPVSEMLVTKIVKASKPTTAAIDPCPSSWIKDHIDIFAPLLTYIINSSFSQNDFADSWKRAVVIPLLKKKGLDLILSNYRPVSNLSYVSKIIERCALEQFNLHLQEDDLLPSYQSAYRSSFSTETALMKIHCDLLSSMEKQEVTAFVGLDLSAAFDTVDHSILLKTLENRYGVHGNARSWFESYLSSRSFHVSVEGATSSDKHINFSVPQGSILGPVLYSVYASPLEDVIDQFDSSVIGYADDHGIYDSFKPSPDQEILTISKLEACLSEVHQWMNSNKLKLNPTKTEFIMFGSRQQLKKCTLDSIYVSGESVGKAPSIKYLGVHLDESLSFAQQITAKCKAALYNLTRIKSIRKYLDIDSCKTLMSSLVLAHLDYANILYYGLPDRDIHKLQRVQNMAAKVVLKRKKYDSATDCLKTLHWLPVRSRIMYKVAVYVFKCLHNTAPLYLSEMIHIKTWQRPLRSADRAGTILHVPFSKNKTFLDRSFLVAGPTVWNGLPKDVRSASSLMQFKSLLKTHLFKSCYLK